MKKKALGLVALMASVSTFAANYQTVESPLLMVATHSQAEGQGLKFGGCYAKLDPNTITLNGCDDNFVSFGCDGLGGFPKSQGSAGYSTAQLAFVMQKSVKMYVTDSRIVNGTCQALNVRVQN